MDGKKISFGFMKTKKVEKPLAIINNDEKKEFIECVEEKSIKILGGEELKTNEPLIIPMKPNTLITPNRLKEIADEVESALDTSEIKVEPLVSDIIEKTAPENETLDQMAVREIMDEAKKEIKVETNAITIPTPAKNVSEGEKESTLEDYETVPIQEFGVALLRGMGWQPNKDSPIYKQPELRPKGLGLGADKVIKQKKNQASKDGKTEELLIMKNAYVKITNGKYANFYGKVVSLDEDNGRVMVDISVKKETVSLSEFMMQAVTKSEYDKESKVINADSYEEYKQKELNHKTSREGQNTSSTNQRQMETERKDEKDRQAEKGYKKEKDYANGRSNNRRDSSSSDDKIKSKKKKDRKRYSSSDSLSSLSEDDRRQHKHNKNKSRSRRSRSKSNPRKRTPEGKRDIDKKRKGKKKKRDRDRSPNYRKHRK